MIRLLRQWLLYLHCVVLLLTVQFSSLIEYLWPHNIKLILDYLRMKVTSKIYYAREQVNDQRRG